MASKWKKMLSLLLYWAKIYGESNTIMPHFHPHKWVYHWSVILQINKCCLTFLATWQQFYYIVIKDGIYGKISLLVTYNIICHVSDNCFWLDTEKNTTTYVYYGLHNSDRIVTVHLETFLHFAKWDMLETLL